MIETYIVAPSTCTFTNKQIVNEAEVVTTNEWYVEREYKISVVGDSVTLVPHADGSTVAFTDVTFVPAKTEAEFVVLHEGLLNVGGDDDDILKNWSQSQITAKLAAIWP